MVTMLKVAPLHLLRDFAQVVDDATGFTIINASVV